MEASPLPERTSKPFQAGLVAGWEWPSRDAAETLVFAHATGFNASAYRSLLGYLPDAIRVIALNQRGHGNSRLPADPRRLRSWQRYGKDLVATLHRAKLGPVHFAGHSMGAMAGVLAAASNPELFRSLTLFDPVLVAPKWYIVMRSPLSAIVRKRMGLAKMAAKRRSSWANRQSVVDAYRGRGIFKEMPEEALLDYLEDGLTETDGGVTLSCAPAWEAATFRAQAYNPWRSLRSLGNLPLPIRIVLAEHGSTMTAPQAKVLAAMPQAQFHKMTGCGHFAPLQQPEIARKHLKSAIAAA